MRRFMRPIARRFAGEVMRFSKGSSIGASTCGASAGMPAQPTCVSQPSCRNRAR